MTSDILKLLPMKGDFYQSSFTEKFCNDGVVGKKKRGFLLKQK